MSPMTTILTTAIDLALPKEFKNSMKNFDKTLSSAIIAGMERSLRSDKGGAIGSILKSIRVPSDVMSIWDNAFAQNQLQQVEFDENSKLTYIGDGAFKDNNLSALVLPYVTM